jgi:3D (Asp-Asp-Asp) domain-containing protein
MALLAEGVVLFLGDEISPALDASVLPGIEVLIRRSRPVKIASDGKQIRTRTQATTVGEVLAQEGVTLVGLDYTLPPEDAPLPESEPIRVVRARRAFAVEEESIPYETVWLPDPELDLDHQRLEQEGQEGVHRWRYDMLYENGQEVVRNLQDEWIAHEPTNKAIAYGTKITVRELETPDGTFEYWRRIKMLATSYTAATCGKTPDHPLYGITRLGWQMRHGIVAVDPSVVSLRSQVYVPGYGEGVAGDTGGAIRGRHIDLGYDEDNLVYWYKWVDVYVLTPIPPLDQIRYVLPNWPRR